MHFSSSTANPSMRRLRIHRPPPQSSSLDCRLMTNSPHSSSSTSSVQYTLLFFPAPIPPTTSLSILRLPSYFFLSFLTLDFICFLSSSSICFRFASSCLLKSSKRHGSLPFSYGSHRIRKWRRPRTLKRRGFEELRRAYAPYNGPSLLCLSNSTVLPTCLSEASPRYLHVGSMRLVAIHSKPPSFCGQATQRSPDVIQANTYR